MLTFLKKKLAVAGAIVLCLALFASYGCGKKGPPKPPDEVQSMKKEEPGR